MSKRFRQIVIFPDFAEFLPEKAKFDALRLMTKLGNNKILKRTEEKFLGTKEFDEVIEVESVRIFNKLKTNGMKYEDASPQKIKRILSPFLMCLKHKRHLFIELIRDYHKICSQGKLQITEKFTTILKSVLKSDEIAGTYFEELLVQRASSGESEEYASLIEKFKDYVELKGDKVRALFSDAITNQVINTGNLSYLAEFSKDMVKEKLIKIILHRSTKDNFSFDDVNEIIEVSKLSTPEILIEIVFYSQQDEKTIPVLRQVEQMLMDKIVPITFSTSEFRQMLLLRLNNILPNRQLLNKETKPVPLLFFPFLLTVIINLRTKAEMQAPWELYLEHVILLIKARKEEEPYVWAGLIRFCKFSKEMTEEKIARILPPDKREKLLLELY